MLIEAVIVVAASASDQAAWLDAHAVPPDEIALGFDDTYGLAETLIEEGHLSREVLPSLQMIDEVFGEMTRDTDGDRWTRQALSTDPGWGRARDLARAVLAAEGEDRSPLPSICVIR
ncbi:hypothetical protein ACGFYZ_19890 [Streptomyces sp. NPDC048330]|uniref:hypothetical protein n=1 Tax=Streptomyces sp. NPDC048330 TaxID=3365533 RepID=UPI00371FBA6D